MTKKIYEIDGYETHSYRIELFTDVDRLQSPCGPSHSHCPLCSCQLVARVDDVLGEDADVVAVVVISLHHWRPILCLADEADGDVAVEEDLRGDVELNLRGGRLDMRQEHLNCLERQFQKFNFQLSKVSSWDCCVVPGICSKKSESESSLMKL